MALLSYSSSPQKGSSVTVTLDTALLLSLNAVATDAFWSGGNDGDVTQAIVTLKTSPGNGKIVLTFDLTQDPCTATLTLPQYCRDVFEISKIVLIDTMGDKVTLDRATLLSEIPTLSESEIQLSAAMAVYTASTVYDNETDFSNTIVWQQNTPALMVPAQTHLGSEASSIGVSGGIVYVGGSTHNQNSTTMPALWTNGSLATIPNSATGNLMPSCVVGSDIYTTAITEDNMRVVVYKNGIEQHDLSYVDFPGSAMLNPADIAVSGTDVYVVCDTYNYSLGTYYFVVFLNGSVLYSSNDGTYYRTFGRSLAISGSDVYVGGVAHTGSNWSDRSVIWKNGSTYAHLLGLVNPNDIRSISVVGPDVYALVGYSIGGSLYKSSSGGALELQFDYSGDDLGRTPMPMKILSSGGVLYTVGYLYDTSWVQNPVAALWTNETLTTLPPYDPINYSQSYASCVFVSGSDVYVGGRQESALFAGTMMVWKNGAPYQVGASFMYDAPGFILHLSGSGGTLAAFGASYNDDIGNLPTCWSGPFGSMTGTILSHEGLGGMAYGGTNVGADVYSVGYVYAADGFYNTPCYWSNTDRYYLDLTGYGQGVANDIVLTGPTSILAGGWVSIGNEIPCIWQGDSLSNSVTELDLNGWARGAVNAVGTADSVIYAAGWVDNLDGLIQPSFWQDGVQTTLDMGDYDVGRVEKMTVVNGSVVLAGYVLSTGDWMGQPCIWVDGMLTLLDLDGAGTGQAFTPRIDQQGNVYVSGVTDGSTPLVWKNNVVYINILVPPTHYYDGDTVCLALT